MHASCSDLLESLLRAEGIPFFAIQARAKTVESLLSKVARKGLVYTDPLTEVTDLAGVRPVLYYVDDVRRVEQLVRREFLVDDANSRVAGRDEPDRFGYTSSHYVVQLNDLRRDLLEWTDLSRLRAEIQVRTVLQHAWAAIEHRLAYKSDADVPPELRRDFSRLSALLEMADREFADLRSRSDALTEALRARVAADDLAVPLDLLSLEVFLDTTGIARRWYEAARVLGFDEQPEMAVSDQMLELGVTMFSWLDGGLRYIRLLLSLAGVQNIHEVEQLLRPFENSDRGESVLAQVLEMAGKSEPSVPVSVYEPAAILLHVATTVSPATVLEYVAEHEEDDEIADFVQGFFVGSLTHALSEFILRSQD